MIYRVSDLLDHLMISQSGLGLDLGTLQCSSQGILHVGSLANFWTDWEFSKGGPLSAQLSGRGLGLVAVELGNRLHLYICKKSQLAHLFGCGPWAALKR
jgi:hypothetical protein